MTMRHLSCEYARHNAEVCRAKCKLTLGTAVSKPPTIAVALLGGVASGLDVDARAVSTAITLILTLIYRDTIKQVQWKNRSQ